nr:immunoglobulin heavy chain junction region [Mus musculus]
CAREGLAYAMDYW